jgi:hypothetical protein
VTETPGPSAPSPFRIPGPIAAVVVVLAVTVVVLLLVGPSRQPPEKTWDRPLDPVALLNRVEGSARAARGDERRDLARGGTVYLGEVIETGSNASLSMKTYPVDAQVEVGADSKLAFESPAEVRVKAGRVRAKVGDAATLFKTPHGNVLGWGTHLSLEVKPGATEVSVEKGTATVDGPGGRKQEVEAGGRLVLSGPAPAGP